MSLHHSFVLTISGRDTLLRELATFLRPAIESYIETFPYSSPKYLLDVERLFPDLNQGCERIILDCQGGTLDDAWFAIATDDYKFSPEDDERYSREVAVVQQLGLENELKRMAALRDRLLRWIERQRSDDPQLLDLPIMRFSGESKYSPLMHLSSPLMERYPELTIECTVYIDFNIFERWVARNGEIERLERMCIEWGDRFWSDDYDLYEDEPHSEETLYPY